MEKFTQDFLNEILDNDVAPWKGVFLDNSGLYAGAYVDEAKRIHFIIECDKTELDEIILEGIEIKHLDIPHDEYGMKKYIDFSPTHKGFLDNALHLCNEILIEISEGVSPVNATEKILRKWMYFLSQPKNSVMSEEKIIGLIGELKVIEWLLEKGFEEFEVFEGWRGPEKHPRDFEMKDFWVEVKSSKTSSCFVEIHGAEQLAKDENKPMFLWVNAVENNSEGFALTDLVNILESKIENALNLGIFRSKLTTCGYNHSMASEYSEFRFKINESKVYEVTDDFPKILNENIDSVSRVSSVNYKINLEGIESITKENLIKYGT